MAQLVLKEIDDNLAANLNGGAGKWQDLYLASVGALQINGGNGVQNNYYIFNIDLNFGGRRKK
jgi:hypothetical protein